MEKLIGLDKRIVWMPNTVAHRPAPSEIYVNKRSPLCLSFSPIGRCDWPKRSVDDREMWLNSINSETVTLSGSIYRQLIVKYEYKERGLSATRFTNWITT